MATKAAHKRLTKEYKALLDNSPPYITAHPSESNILEWHYLIDGPKDTPYEGGQYHGTLTFTYEYPFKPPAIRMITPNGRFQTNTRLCLSMSDFHPDLWNPAWNVSTILNGLLSFMTGDEPTTGSIQTSDETKRKFAQASMEWNCNKNPKFKEQFPEEIELNYKKIQERKEREQSKINTPNLIKVPSLTNIDLNKMDPEDRIRYLASLKRESNSIGNSYSHWVYYILGIALVLGFFKFAN